MVCCHVGRPGTTAAAAGGDVDVDDDDDVSEASNDVQLPRPTNELLPCEIRLVVVVVQPFATLLKLF